MAISWATRRIDLVPGNCDSPFFRNAPPRSIFIHNHTYIHTYITYIHISYIYIIYIYHIYIQYFTRLLHRAVLGKSSPLQALCWELPYRQPTSRRRTSVLMPSLAKTICFNTRFRTLPTRSSRLVSEVGLRWRCRHGPMAMMNMLGVDHSIIKCGCFLLFYQQIG